MPHSRADLRQLIKAKDFETALAGALELAREKPQAKIEQIEALVGMDQWSAAHAVFQELGKDHPEIGLSLRLRRLQARAALKSGQIQRGLALADELLDRDPDDLAAARCRVDAMVELEEWAQLSDFAADAATRWPDVPRFQRARMRALSRLGDVATLRSVGEQHMERFSFDPFVQRQICEAAATQSDWPGLLHAAQRGFDHAPTEFRFVQHLIRAAVELGEEGVIEEVANALLAEGSDTPNARRSLIEIMAWRGSPDPLLALLSEWDDPALTGQGAQALERAGQVGSARDLWRSLATDDLDDIPLLRAKSAFFRRHSPADEAEKSLLRELSLQPSSLKARAALLLDLRDQPDRVRELDLLARFDVPAKAAPGDMVILCYHLARHTSLVARDDLVARFAGITEADLIHTPAHVRQAAIVVSVLLGRYDLAHTLYGTEDRRCPLQPRPTAAHPGRAIILDPGYRFTAGHHHNYTLFFDSFLRARDLTPAVLGNTENKGAAEQGIVDFAPAFHFSPYLFNSFLHSDAEMERVNGFFEYELDRLALPQSGTIVIALHSLRATFVVGLMRFIARRCAHLDVCLLAGVIEFDHLDPGHLHHDLAPVAYRTAIDILETCDHVSSIFFVETEPGRAFLQDLFGAGHEVHLYPYLAVGMVDVPSRSVDVKADSRPLRVAYLGATREPKGYHLIPGTVLAADDLRDQITWDIQMDMDILQRSLGPEGWAEVAQFGEGDHVALHPPRLELDTYMRLLTQADIVLLPYSTRYESSGSGIFLEAVALGTPVIIPSQSYMAQVLRDLDIDVVSFDTQSPDAIATALRDCVARYPEVYASFQAGADRWNRDHRPDIRFGRHVDQEMGRLLDAARQRTP